MEEKRSGGYILICSIYTLLFACLTGGGSFLYMYMVSEHPREWHMVAGMVLVGLPWCFWISTCAYSFVKHSFMLHHPKSVVDIPPSAKHVCEKADYNRVSLDSPKMGNRSSTDSNSPMDASSSEGDRHATFSGVIVIGDEEGQGRSRGQDENKIQEDHNKETEFPIASSV